MQGEDHFEVLKITNVTFPFSNIWASTFNNTFNPNIKDFSVCYRFLLDSYNDKEFRPFHARPKDQSTRKEIFEAIEGTGNNLGWGTEGYQGGYTYFGEEVAERMPTRHHFNLAMNIEISTWQHICSSFSSSLKRQHLFQNGFKSFGFNYPKDQDVYIPDDLFAIIKLGFNLRGLITDVNIFSEYFDEEAIMSWTNECSHRKGDIFAWEPTKLSHNEGVTVTILNIDKSEVCSNVMNDMKIQKPIESSNKKKNVVC